MTETSETLTDAKGAFTLGDSFTLRLEMLSDWHVGAGFGRPGNIDSLVQRDADDLPFVPAKTLTGIWRDALERLAYALDAEDTIHGGAAAEREKDDQRGREKITWSKWVDFLFGSQPALPGAPPAVKPNEARLEIKPAYLPDLLRVRLQGKERKPLRDALTFIKPGVQIEDASGTSETDFLRFEEMARVASILEAQCRLHWQNVDVEVDQKQAVSALLSASALLVERIGGRRRRGSGRCRLVLIGLDAGEAIDWLEARKEAPALPRELGSSHQEKKDKLDAKATANALADDDGRTTRKDWIAVPLRLILKQPISIAARTLGNVTETLDYVPGTYLLPHITNRLKDALHQIGEDCHQLVASARLQVLPATIEINAQRGLPVPSAIFRHKVGGGFDQTKRTQIDGETKTTMTVLNRFREEARAEIQLKGYRSGYIEPVESKQLPSYVQVPLTLLTHNTVKDEVQRPTSEVGGVYSREAIAPSATLRTELRLSRSLNDKLKAKDAQWWSKLAGGCRLGVSSKDDYGAAEIEVVLADREDSAPSPNNGEKQEGGPQAENQEDADAKEHPKQDRLVVWLQSDVLLRSSSLRPTIDGEDLRRKLEALINREMKSDENGETRNSVTLELVTSDASNRLLTSLLYTRRIESWQKSWGRPRPSLVALAAGSCVVFKLSGPIDARLREALRVFEDEGIGERRAEGYGRISFNSALLTEELKCWNAATDSGGSRDPISVLPELVSTEQYKPTYDFAQLIEETAWRTGLRRAVLRVAGNEQKRAELVCLSKDSKKPSMSQLGSLRAAIDQLQTAVTNADERKKRDTEKGRVEAWREHAEKTRKDNWPKGAFAAIKKLIDDEAFVWQAMVDEWKVPPTLTKEGTTRLKEKLWAEAVRSLVDACIRAHKRATETRSQGQRITA